MNGELMDSTTGALTPTVVFIDNPFGTIFVPPVPVCIGVPIRSTKPPLAPDVRVMLRVSNEWLLQADWDSHIRPGDKIEWHVCLPQGGNASRLILQIVAFIVIAYLTAGIGNVYLQAAARIALGLAATALINAVVPPAKVGGGNAASPNSVYNVQISGNQARLNAPLPVLYGRNLTYPDFAAQPYSEYANNDQFYHVLFCLGQGYYSIERLQIDDTNFQAFRDIWYKILQPGDKPTRVLPNVVTAPEVVDQDMSSHIYVGGFAASGPQTVAEFIGLDFEFPQGLSHLTTDGDTNHFTVVLQAEYQPIDDFGAPLSAWALLGNFSFSAATTTPQRISRKFPLPTPGRVLVRVIRTSALSDHQRDINQCHWTALRAYLAYDEAEVFEPTATHIEVRIRANQQLSQFTQRKIGVISTRKLRSWNPIDGWSVDVAPTREISHALMDMWSDDTYGSALDDSRIDLQTLYDTQLVWTARQDHLDIVFDSKTTAWEAAKIICQAGRSTPFRRYGVCTLSRDQYQELPVTSFNSRNIRPNSVSIGYALATEVTADAVIIEYFDNRVWDWIQIVCKAPGVVTPLNPVISRIAGITGRTQALREGTYMVVVNTYRRKFTSWETEMQGLLPCFGDKILLAPVLSQWATVGDVIDWDQVTLTVTLSEPVAFTGTGTHDVRFQRANSTLTNAIPVTPGVAANQVVLADYPDGDPNFNFNISSASRQRTKFVFGAGVTILGAAKLLGITKRERNDNNVQMIQMSAVNEDDRVHTADLAYLPAPGEIQDPVPTGEIDGEAVDQPAPGTFGVAVLSSHVFDAFNSAADPGDLVEPRPSITFSLNVNGSFTWGVHNRFDLPTGDTSGVFTGEWNLNLLDLTTAPSYSVRLTNAGNPTLMNKVSGPALNVWVPVDTDLTWVFDDDTYPEKGFTNFTNIYQVQIMWGGAVQASAYIQLNIWLQTFVDYIGAGSDNGDGDGDDGDDGDSGDSGDSGDGSGDGGDGDGGDGDGGE